jgi:hypothetical protein
MRPHESIRGAGRLALRSILAYWCPEYEVDGRLWLRNHYPGGYIFRDKINLEAIPPGRGNPNWRLRYGFDSRSPNRTTRNLEPQVERDGFRFRIPIVQNSKPGIRAHLELMARPWNS